MPSDSAGKACAEQMLLATVPGYSPTATSLPLTWLLSQLTWGKGLIMAPCNYMFIPQGPHKAYHVLDNLLLSTGQSG